MKWADKEKSLLDTFLDEKIPIFYRWRLKSLERKDDYYDEENISELKYNIETYRQLKASSIANHNKVEALSFYRNEMKLYWKLIRIEGGIPWTDRVLVFLNRWISDFGQNWFLPIFWMFVLNWVYYLFDASFDFSVSPTNVWNGFLEVIKFMNLGRIISKIGTSETEVSSFLMGILNAYLIYHFIRASRKFGKTE